MYEKGNNNTSRGGEDEDCNKNTNKAETDLMCLAILRLNSVCIIYHHLGGKQTDHQTNSWG